MPDQLVRVLSEIQRRGGIGRGPVEDAIEHAQSFVDAIPAGSATVIDLGSGGGLPALVIAERRPELDVTLVERRAKRADLLRYGIHALQLGHRARVIEADVHKRPGLGPVDVVTARSFGPLAEVFRAAAVLVRPGGVCIVSTPPEGLLTDGAQIEHADVLVDDAQVGAVHRWVRR